MQSEGGDPCVNVHLMSFYAVHQTSRTGPQPNILTQILIFGETIATILEFRLLVSQVPDVEGGVTSMTSKLLLI